MLAQEVGRGSSSFIYGKSSVWYSNVFETENKVQRRVGGCQYPAPVDTNNGTVI
jgi:hypothetical protein